MTTSLSQQLKKLSTPQTSILDHKKKKVSILYTASEAAEYSRDIYYEIGLSGFTELSEVSEKFLKFRDALFGEKSKDFQRAIQTKEVNEKLDKEIEAFLLLLSPYLQKQASLKALEWLVQRFSIQSMNTDALLMCILPYYETVLFVRILQIIDIRDAASPWHWLNHSQLKGRPIPKDTVFLHWASDQWFRNFLSKYFRKVLKMPHDDIHLQVASSLLITTQIGGLSAAQKVTEDHLSSISQTLQRCLQSTNRDVLSGTLLLVSHMSLSASLSGEILKEIIERMIMQQNDWYLTEHCCVCLLNVFYHQDLASLSPNAIKALEERPSLLRQISKISETKSVGAFLVPYTKALIGFIMTNDELDEKEKRNRLLHLADYLEEICLGPEEASFVVRAFVHSLAKFGDSLEKFLSPQNFVTLLKKLEKSHPDGFDAASSDILEESRRSSTTVVMFEKNAIKMFRKKYIISSSTKSISKKVSKVLSSEELWLDLRKVRQLSSSTKQFIDEVFSAVKLKSKQHVSDLWIINDEQDELITSVKVVARLLHVVLLHQANGTNADLCDSILKRIFKDQLTTTRSKLYFLSMIWSIDSDKQQEIGISEHLKVWALKFALTLLKSSNPSLGPVAWVVDCQELFVPSLFIPICEGDDHCSAALDVIEATTLIAGVGLRQNGMLALVQSIVESKEEISSDPSFLPRAIGRLISKKRIHGKKIVDSLFSFVESPSVPLHVKAAVLYSLSQVEDSTLFSRLVPLGNSLLDRVEDLKKEGQVLNSASSSCLYYILLRLLSSEGSEAAGDAVLLKVTGGWQMFQRALVLSRPALNVAGQVMSPQDLVANYKLLRAVSDSPRLVDVLDGLITRVVSTNNTKEAAKLKKELKKIDLSAAQIISLLRKYDLTPNFSSIKEARAKKLKQQKGEEEKDSANWAKLELVVELIGVVPSLKEPWILVGPICDHLQALVKVEAPFADQLRQQMLSVCLHLLEVCSKILSTEEFAKKCQLNVALIVQTIRTSINPDTHRRALMILSLASKYFPDQVLHNIMAIFTFIGSSLLKRDDAYSYQVIRTTVSSIVPVFIQSKNSDPLELVRKLSHVTQVFVDALPDLTEHRRLPLFTQLAQTLGVSQYLWLVMVLIADAYVTRGNAKAPPPPSNVPSSLRRRIDSSSFEAHPEGPTGGDRQTSDPDPRCLPGNIHFALVLYSQFSVVDQLKASCEVLSFVVDLPHSKEEGKSKGENLSTAAIDVSAKTSRQLRQLKYSCLGLLIHLLSSEKFVFQVFEYTKESQSTLTELKELYREVLDKSLRYLKVVSQLERSLKGDPNGRFWAAMQKKLMDLVDAVNSLLPPALLVEIVSKLIDSSIDDVRCRAMEILASKLQPETKFFSDDQQLEDLLEFAEPLRLIGMDAKQREENRQTAFFTLQLLVRKVSGKVDSELILPILDSTAKLVKAADAPDRVLTQASLVVAESIGVVKVQAVGLLESLVPSYLSILRRTLHAEESDCLDNLAIASATAIHRIVEHLPRLLPRDQLMELLEVCCRLISKRECAEETRLTSRLVGALEHLTKNVELRILIPSLSQTYENMSAQCPRSLPSLMKVIESLIKFVRPQQLVLAKQQFIDIFVSSLDVRHSLASETVAADQVETCVISALTRFLLKLDEDDNIAMLLMLQNWASDSVPSRLTTFFRFSSELASCLKVLFLKARLADKVFDFAIHNLNANNNVHHSETVFGSGQEAETRACELLRFVLDTLAKIFLFDSAQFVTDERFAAVIEPLFSQIENTVGSEEEFQDRVSNHLKPCVIRLTKALSDDAQAKEVNRQVLQRVKTDNEPKVILAGLEIFEGLMDELGEEFVQSVLHDTIPCITEVLESLDSDVERKTKHVYLKMEALVGDSLKAYLDS